MSGATSQKLILIIKKITKKIINFLFIKKIFKLNFFIISINEVIIIIAQIRINEISIK